MSEAYPWYGLAQGNELEQGDFIVSCPVYNVTTDGMIRRDECAVIILSHSCDLVQDKLEIVQVCPVHSLDELSQHVEYLRSKRGREELQRGNLVGYHLLNRCQLVGFALDFQVCDFRSLFGVSLTTARQLASEQSPRLPLLPPYREHLAQAFARFFMRVGLPVDVPPFQ